MGSNNSPSNTITLPPGVQIIARRETSSQGPNGAIQQGMNFTLQLASGATTSVFIPYNLIGNTQAVAATFNERIASIQAIEALQA